MSDPTQPWKKDDPTPARAEPTITSKEQFEAALAQARGPVLVDFIQPDCQPCIDETDNFNQLANACKDSNSPATVMRVDVTQGFGAELAEKLDVEGTPTALFAENAADFNAGKTRELVDLGASSVRRKLKCAVK